MLPVVLDQCVNLLKNGIVARDLDPLFVKKESLDWALEHIKRFGDSDIFPVPFEYGAYAAVWPEIGDYLVSVDLAHSEVTGSLKMMVPKHSEGFRGATQLNPFDALLYTALVYESAAEIEAFRKPVDVACAYRLDLHADGRLFQKDSGWSQFHASSEDRVNGDNCSFVLSADISDFYNQISHHRVQGALAQAGVEENRSQVIERFLGNVNALHHSRGIPVGPPVSILLAEACLADVDNFLGRKYSHTRYVDDFRIFCATHEEALVALHDLSEYLYTAHRLSLQSGKTRILPKEEFKGEELTDPEAQEREAKEALIKEALEQIQKNGYPDQEEEEEEEEKEEEKEEGKAEIDEAKIALEALAELLETVISARYFPLALARYVFRRAASLRCRAILPVVLQNIVTFAPVLRDVMLYLIKISHPQNHELIGRTLTHLITQSEFRSFPFVQYWVLSAIQRVPEFSNADAAMYLAGQSDPSIRDRMLALTAKAYNLTDWVRGKKETWSNTSVWAQRANIWGAEILPREERNHWLRPIRNNPERSIKAVADAAFVIYRDKP